MDRWAGGRGAGGRGGEGATAGGGESSIDPGDSWAPEWEHWVTTTEINVRPFH